MTDGFQDVPFTLFYSAVAHVSVTDGRIINNRDSFRYKLHKGRLVWVLSLIVQTGPGRVPDMIEAP